jgi:hypothetical protein
MSTQSKDSVLGTLQRLLGPLEANKDELGFLEGPITKLTDMVGQAQLVSKEQAAFIAGKQESSKKLNLLLGDSQRLATVIRAAIREHYGIRSEKLAEFGLQPFRGRARKAKPAPEEVPTVEKIEKTAPEAE